MQTVTLNQRTNHERSNTNCNSNICNDIYNRACGLVGKGGIVSLSSEHRFQQIISSAARGDGTLNIDPLRDLFKQRKALAEYMMNAPITKDLRTAFDYNSMEIARFLGIDYLIGDK